MDLRGKRALVTGGARRLGAAVARALAREGCDVALHYRTSRREAEAVARELRALGRGCTLHRADLASAAQVRRLAQAVLAGGPCQVLVNSASIFPRSGLLEATEAEFDRTYAVNLRAPAVLMRAVAADLRRRGLEGRIVNIADAGASTAWAGAVPYSVSKAGLLHLTRVAAVALAPRILVSSVSPGPMVMPEGADAAARRASLRRSLLGRLGGGEEVARAVLFAATSDFVTGSDLRVDGGRALT